MTEPDEPEVRPASSFRDYVVAREWEWRGFLRYPHCPRCGKTWVVTWNHGALQCCGLTLAIPPDTTPKSDSP